MSAVDSPKPPAEEDPPSRSLPPVEAPTGSFILQLFLIPLVIVTMVVMVWLMFSWLAHMGQDDPKTIITQLRKRDDSFGQRAYELAEQLRSPDPQFDKLRSDPELLKELISLLEADLDLKTKEKPDEVRLKRRMFLCRAVGSFHIPDGVPVLIRCVQDSTTENANVQLSALEAITTLAKNVGPEEIRDEKDLLATVLAASRVADDESPPPAPASSKDGESFYKPRGEVRAVAAYTLGVLGGPEAEERLATMLTFETYPNARYNAATGLARRGDVRCIPVLKEMLQTDNPLAAKDERGERDKDNKRVIVLRNGIQTTVILAQKNPSADLTTLQEALQKIIDSDLAAIKTDRSKLQIAAKEAQRMLAKRK
ncbi:MAG: HEAT repeat domain-containing protein [Pirellulaceae bacterium]